ncbi:MAG: glutamate--tRNA ligase family protein [Planctomycetota bacterium]
MSTALFNWLLARQAGGQFILRIDDTDQQRNLDAAVGPILDGFRWLGMQWDEGPTGDDKQCTGPHGSYFQSQRSVAHQQAAAALIDSGYAYHDFSTPEEYGQQRQAAKDEGRPFVYDRQWMATDDASAQKFAAEGRQSVVRLKMPREGTCVVEDLCQGTVKFDWIGEPDHVICRGDGSCLYHLASIVDDLDMEITHVVRAAEHLANTPRQIFIAQSLGRSAPQFAHVPYVAEPGGTAKLSKRKLKKYLKQKDFANMMQHGESIADRGNLITNEETFNPVLVDFYRDIGFLPQPMLNYLVLLGWSLDGETEKFTIQEMIDAFSLQRVNKSPASFDPQKLLSFQGDGMVAMDEGTKRKMVMPYLVSANLVQDPENPETVAAVDAILRYTGDRIKVAGDILDYAFCFVASDQLQFDEKAYAKRISKDGDSIPRLRQIANVLRSLQSFDAATLEAAIKGFCSDEEIKIGQIIHALRVATTGQPVGFGMFDTLQVLGREESVARIDRVCDRESQ